MTICKQGSQSAKFVPILLNVVAIPARLQTGSSNMQILAIFSNILHNFLDLPYRLGFKNQLMFTDVTV
jgi:hypothetical protein